MAADCVQDNLWQAQQQQKKFRTTSRSVSPGPPQQHQRQTPPRSKSNASSVGEDIRQSKSSFSRKLSLLIVALCSYIGAVNFWIPKGDASPVERSQSYPMIDKPSKTLTHLEVTERPHNLPKEVEPTPQELFHATLVGFSKCGTTSFSQWFSDHPELSCHPTREQMYLAGSYDEAKEKINKWYKTYHNTSDPILKIVTKHPEAIYSVPDMEMLRNKFPKTRVIVGMRHPYLWWLSFYNFRTVDRIQRHLPHPTKLIGACSRRYQHECTDHGRFHFHLAQAFAKTPMTSARELKLLVGNSSTESLFNISSRPIPNKVFFYETQQLTDKNETRNAKFRRDLADFLGLDESFPLPPKVKPESQLPQTRLELRARWKIQDFCREEYASVREVLLQHSRDVADWIQDFFLKSDIVVSSPDHLYSLFDYYRTDPLNCANRSDISTVKWGNAKYQKPEE